MSKKYLLILGLICFFTLESNAQAFQWAKQFKSRVSYGTDVVVDNNFNVISCGWFYDTVDLNPGPAQFLHYSYLFGNNQNSYISKLDANGNFVWGYSYNNTQYNRLHAIDVDNQDNVYVLGHFRDSIDLDFGVNDYWLYDQNNNNSYYDNFFVAKYNPNGQLLWGYAYVNYSSVYNQALWAFDLKVDNNDDVLISGRFRDSVDFDPSAGVDIRVSNSSSTSNWYADKFLLKLDANGNYNWVRTWEHSGGYWNNGWWGNHELDVDPNNNIFMPITFFDSLDTDPGPLTDMVYTQGAHDVSFLKISPSGSLVWHKEIGGPGQEYCHSLATDPWGNIYYSLQTYSNPLDVDPGPGQNWVNWGGLNWGKIIVKLDNNGDFIWALQNLSNNYYSSWHGEGMATDTAGGLYLTTRIYPNSFNNNLWDLDPGPGAYIVSSAGSGDIAFQSFDSSGAFIWGGAMGGPLYDYCYGISTDQARGVYLTGTFHSTADLNPTQDTTFLTNTPNSVDAFVVKLNNCNVVTNQILQACDSVIYNNQVFYSDTVFQFHYPASNGCDSSHAVVIDIQNLRDTIAAHGCETYTWHSNVYNNSGFYTQPFLSVLGCDSSEVLDLTISPNTTQTINVSSCNDTTINGVLYNSSGLYTQNYLSQDSCDSIVKINFTKYTVDTSVSYSGNTSLLANASAATYQWYDCNTMQIISGATSPTYTANVTGDYACIVTQNGCTDTSACYSIVVTPDAVNDFTMLSRLYPNPSKGNFHLELNKKFKNVHLEVRTISGQLIWQKEFAALKETDISIEKASGVYMLYIKQAGRTQVKKLMKW